MTTSRKPMPRLGSGGPFASEHLAFHTGPFRPLLEEIPEWAAARDALVALDGIKLPTGGADPADLAEKLIEHARAGTATTDELMAAAVAAAEASTALDAARTALDLARAELIQELDAAVDDNVSKLWDNLARQHADAWARLTAIKDPASLADAATAIDSNRVDDYRTWRSTLTEINAIRGRYAKLADHFGGIADPSAPDTWFKDLDVWDLYAAWANGHTMNHNTSTGETEPIIPPWERGDAAPIGSEPWILWALGQHDLTVWLPTPTELAANQQALRDHANAWAAGFTGDGNQPLTSAARRREQWTVRNQMHTDH